MSKEYESEQNKEVLDEKELSDEEKREIYIDGLKNANNNFAPIRHDGNTTTNQYGGFRKKRQKKNKATKASRKNNR